MTTLSNPTTGPLTSRVMADLDDEVFNYFFAPDRSALQRVRGARQALIAQFFVALKAHCETEGIRPRWEPEHESWIQDFMSNLNFTKHE